MSSIAANTSYSHQPSPFTGPNQLLVSGNGTFDMTTVSFEGASTGSVLVRTASGLAAGLVPSSSLSFPLLAPAGSDSAPSYSFVDSSNTGLFQPSSSSVAINVGGTRVFEASPTVGLKLVSSGPVTSANPDTATIAVSNNGAGSVNMLGAQCVLMASKQSGIGSISVGSQSVVAACGLGCETVGASTGSAVVVSSSFMAGCRVTDEAAKVAIAGSAGVLAYKSEIASDLAITGPNNFVGAASGSAAMSGANGLIMASSLGVATAVSTIGTANALIAVDANPAGTATSTVQAAGSATGLLFVQSGASGSGASTSATGNGAAVISCVNTTSGGAIVASGNGAAVVASNPGGGTITSSGSGSAVMACGTGCTASAARSVVMCATNSTADDQNAAVIGGDGLNSQAVNSLTCANVYTGTLNMTCDASQKADMTNVPLEEAAYVTKLRAIKPKKYRMKRDDKDAPKRRGFDADDLDAFGGVVFRKSRRPVHVRQTESGRWEDENGRKYNAAIPDPEPDPDVYDENGELLPPADPRPRGIVYEDKALSHAVVDATAMMAVIWEGLIHMQAQIDRAAARLVSVKVGL